MIGHTKSHCYELVGYLEWWDHSCKKNPKRTSIVVKIKIKDDVAKKASSLVVATNNGGKVLNISTPLSNNTWIIDSDVTNYMTFDSRVSSFKLSLQKVVSTTNDNTTLVIGERSLTLTDTLNLDSVLIISFLDYNLLSVSQITTTLSCVVILWPKFCVFKDIQTKQTIGCDIKRGKL